MKFTRFDFQGEKKSGVVLDNKIVEIDGGFWGDIRLLNKTYEKNEVKILPPSIPGKIIAVGLNYVDHAKELGFEKPNNPVIFVKLPHTIIAHEECILIPPGYNCVDYEAELALVIKKECINVEAREAGDYILGAMCLNDVTQRQVQKQDGQWTRAKNYKTFCPMGPCIVNDIDYNNINISLTLNGEEKQRSNTRNFLWSVEEVISFISKTIPLYAGDVVTTGTPAGVGPMKQGDVVEVSIENIGVLRNKVISDPLNS